MGEIRGVAHVVLGVRDTRRSITFYTEVLGMELVNFIEEIQIAFFSFGERDHDIAVIAVPEDAHVGSPGLSHTALQIHGGPEQLRAIKTRLEAAGVEVEFTVDHVLTKSLYLLDPDGNRLELFAQAMSDSVGKDYLHNARTVGDLNQPLDLDLEVVSG